MPPRKTIIAPSILACDFARLADEVRRVDEAGADWIHCDVMDGHFVDNISFGPAFVEAAARHTNLPIDVHLMIERPDHYLPRFLPHAQCITSHVEAQHDIPSTLRKVRDSGCLAGLALNPATPLQRIEPFLGQFDLLLVMTVVPGFGGQPFMDTMLAKVREAATWAAELGFHIQVDGGINPHTGAACLAAGADVLVAGTSVFKAPDTTREIAALRQLPTP